MNATIRVTPGQIAATRAMLRFCKEHEHAPGWIQRLDACVHALDAADLDAVAECLRPFGSAGMGSFIDWFPATPSAAEDGEYIEVLWNALYGHWRDQIKPHWPRQR